MNKTLIEYRSRKLNIDKDLFDKYAYLRKRQINTDDIDQYLLNEADKTGLDPFNIDPDMIADRYSKEQIEAIINKCLRFEIRLRGGKI